MVFFSGHGLASAEQVFSIPITRDTGVSSVGSERNANNGGAKKLKLKGSQEYILWDIDPAKLKGRLIRRATLHVCSASPQDAPLLRVGCLLWQLRGRRAVHSGIFPRRAVPALPRQPIKSRTGRLQAAI